MAAGDAARGVPAILLLRRDPGLGHGAGNDV